MTANRYFHAVVVPMLIMIVSYCSPTVSADTSNNSVSIKRLLPSDQEINSWRREGEEKLYQGNELFMHINGGADSFYEYGFNRVITQIYVNENTNVEVSIYEMDNPSAAFGIYSLQRDQNAPVLETGDDGFQSDHVTAFWQDKYYTVIAPLEVNSIPGGILYQFAEIISGKIGEGSKPPEFLLRLPPTGLIPRSLIYLKGELGLNTLFYLPPEEKLIAGSGFVEAGFGIYQFDNEKARLLMIQYADPEEAQKKKEMVLRVFSREYQDCLTNEFKMFKDRKGRFYSARSVDRFLYIVFKSSSQTAAEKVFQQISF